MGKKNRPALSRAIKPNGAKLYVAVFGGRELKTLFLQPKCKQIIYLFAVFHRTCVASFS
jgi:hypothetical protein